MLHHQSLYTASAFVLAQRAFVSKVDLKELPTQLWAGYARNEMEIDDESVLVDVGSGEVKYFHVKLGRDKSLQSEQLYPKSDDKEKGIKDTKPPRLYMLVEAACLSMDLRTLETAQKKIDDFEDDGDESFGIPPNTKEGFVRLLYDEFVGTKNVIMNEQQLKLPTKFICTQKMRELSTKSESFS